MTSILDALKQANSAATAQPAAGLGATSQITDLLKAKSNTAPASPVGTGAPKQTTIGEALAVDTTQAQMGQTAQGAAQQEAAVQVQSDAQKQQLVQAEGELEAQRLGLAEKAASEEAKLLEAARQAKVAGDEARWELALERASLLRRLRNDAYIQDLKQQGDMRRLGDETSFREALSHEVFGEELGTLQQILGGKEILAMSRSDFNASMEMLSAQHSLDIAELEGKTAATKGMWEGIGALGQGAVGVAAMKPDPETDTDTDPGAGQSGGHKNAPMKNDGR
jgi:hypothetical protein